MSKANDTTRSTNDQDPDIQSIVPRRYAALAVTTSVLGLHGTKKGLTKRRTPTEGLREIRTLLTHRTTSGPKTGAIARIGLSGGTRIATGAATHIARVVTIIPSKVRTRGIKRAARILKVQVPSKTQAQLTAVRMRTTLCGLKA